jgi:polysaccharide deacetylase family protein (PEP-CTERM system associated)
MFLNALTVDVEDWHQLASAKLLGRTVPASKRVVANTHRILDVLAEHNVRATFFVLGTVAERFPDLVRRIVREGHEVGTHGYSHRLVSAMTPQAFDAELRHSISILEEIAREPVWGHRAAEFSLNDSTHWALEIMAAAGLRYDSSVFPIRHPRYGMPAAPRHPHLIRTPMGSLVEFPLATAKVLGQNVPVAGGGYLRILPLSMIHWGIRALNREGQPAVIYVHPYEFDQEWLDLAVPYQSTRRWMELRWRALKRNWGRGEPMLVKFKAVLRSFDFAPLREVMAYGTGWDDSDLFREKRPTVRSALPAGSSSAEAF